MQPSFEDLPPLVPLLDFLAAHLPDPLPEFQSWHIQRVLGGQNNLLFRVTTDAVSIAIKFVRRDARDRAGREFAALHALQHIDPTLAPLPLFLDRDTYALPVVVQSWLEGTSQAAMPATPAEWHLLVQHLRAIHRVRPTHVAHSILPAMLNTTQAQEGVQRILNGWHTLPAGAYPDALNDLVRQMQRWRWPEWPQPEHTLCRVDPNILNFIRSPFQWASVDWENSGWGDPAFEVGDLMAHPAYTAVPSELWERVIHTYCEDSPDRTLALRIRTYHLLGLVDWAVFFARKANEYAQGRQPKERLVNRPAEWYAALPQQAAHYTEAAAKAFQSLPSV
jgi:aminoglycoside phosphotransferase (APT) family kinase protein